MGDMKVNGPTQLHPDVLNREARENERWDGQEKVEEFLVRQAGVHADAVRYDLANAALSFANIGVGAAQTVGGTLAALKDLGDAGWAQLTAQDLARKLDKERQELDHKDEITTHYQIRRDKMEIAAANLRALNEEDWPLVKEGLKRIVHGAGFTVLDIVSMPIDAVAALINVSVAGGVTARKASVAAGKAIGNGLHEARVAINEAGRDARVALKENAEAALDAGRSIVSRAADMVRENYEDEIGWITPQAAQEANGAASKATPVQLQQLPDHAPQADK